MAKSPEVQYLWLPALALQTRLIWFAMAFRALFFSRNPDTVDALKDILEETGIRAEVSTDIFGAIEKGTKQPFACILADWVDQPEAGFLLKRARESGPNRNTVVIAIVDGDPSPEEEREHRLDFLIYRPITPDEVRAVLAKARQQIQLHSTAFDTDAESSLDHPELAGAQVSGDPNLVEVAADLPETLAPTELPELEGEEGTIADDDVRHGPSRLGAVLRSAVAIPLVCIAGYCVWNARAALQYLATTREGRVQVLRESFAALFYANHTGAQPVGSEVTDAQQDAYFTRTPAKPNSQPGSVEVVSAGLEVPELRHLRPALDFPLPAPEMRVEPAPAPAKRAPLPDSLRASAPITPPPSLTVTPGQIMPVSSPPPAPSIASQYGDSVHLTEEAARALVIHTVDPVYPQEARAQKLQGPVVLQTIIGRDGTVQDVKLVRGYFVLAKAAIAALKQWRFRPSTINGRPVEAQTVITVTFTYPSS